MLNVPGGKCPDAAPLQIWMRGGDGKRDKMELKTTL